MFQISLWEGSSSFTDIPPPYKLFDLGKNNLILWDAFPPLLSDPEPHLPI